MEITQEMLAELSPIVRQEIERMKAEAAENRTAWKRLKKEFEERLAGFNYVVDKEYHLTDGSLHHLTSTKRYDHKLLYALSTLLRAVYRVEHVDKIPSEKEREMREFMDRVLTLMEEWQEK